LYIQQQIKPQFLLDFCFSSQHEFEIEARFDHIEFKLDLIQQNAKFFLEILHNQKSDTLEWIIIILISFECMLMLMDMTGVGPSLLQDKVSSLVG
jgi:uncharacterized Rmd1/YagE family protein